MALFLWLLSVLLRVHAASQHLCIAYTALLFLHLPWPEPSWCYAFWLAVHWPTFGPKGRRKVAAEFKEAHLRQEVQEYMAANAGARPSATSAVYQRLKRAQLLHLLHDIEAETDEQRERRLREELAEHLRAQAGSRPSWTSPLYI